jgi:hypothetical protein
VVRGRRSYRAIAYEWENLPDGSTVVDVGGGGMGNVSHVVAKNFPKLQVVVQDLPSIIEDGRSVSVVFLAVLASHNILSGGLQMSLDPLNLGVLF